MVKGSNQLKGKQNFRILVDGGNPVMYYIPPPSATREFVPLKPQTYNLTYEKQRCLSSSPTHVHRTISPRGQFKESTTKERSSVLQPPACHLHAPVNLNLASGTFEDSAQIDTRTKR
jgi:hypothetical protein